MGPDAGFASSAEHLAAELARLDERLSASPGPARLAELDAAVEAGVAGATAPLRLAALAELFGLAPFDIDVVVACLAPEIDRGYERLFAVRHDDATRTAPTPGLLLELLCGDLVDRMAARRRFGPAAPLRRFALLSPTDPPDRPASLLGVDLRLAPRVAAFLLEDDALDPDLAGTCRRTRPEGGLAELVLAPDLAERLAVLTRHPADDLVVHLRGEPGAGRRSVAAALCAEWDAALLLVDGRRVAGGTAEEFAAALVRVDREARLSGALLCWDGLDALLVPDREDRLDALLAMLADAPGPAFLGGSADWVPARPPPALGVVRIDVDPPGPAERARLWATALGPERAGACPELDEVAARFRLSATAVRAAAATALGRARARDPAAPSPTGEDLYAAARAHSRRALTALARPVALRHGWDDLVLPAERIGQLREIADQVRHRALVHGTWGFPGTAAGGHGVTVLFAGPSGTGKTMAAGVLARAVGLDLYVIDLSTVVSKYVGETEKNLGRIFAEAASGEVVLFFDEADALFGRRTAVHDAHDRYANIETSYLLQQLESHDGVVVLATNLRKNMDEAFVRRFTATVEFGVPDRADRLRIWRQVWPSATPRAADLDLDRLAEVVELPGGNIRNIALTGAYLAAADGGVVTMEQLVTAACREYRKLGTVHLPEALRPRTG